MVVRWTQPLGVVIGGRMKSSTTALWEKFWAAFEAEEYVSALKLIERIAAE